MALLYLMAIVLLLRLNMLLAHPKNLYSDIWNQIEENENIATSALRIEKLNSVHSYESVLTLAYDIPIPDPLLDCPDFFSDLLTPQVCARSKTTQFYCDRMSEYRELLKSCKSEMEPAYSFEYGNSLDDVDIVRVGIDSRPISQHLLEDHLTQDDKMRKATLGIMKSSTLDEGRNNEMAERKQFKEEATKAVQHTLDTISKMGDTHDEYYVKYMATTIFNKCKRRAVNTNRWIVSTHKLCSAKDRDIQAAEAFSSAKVRRDNMVKLGYIKELLEEFQPVLAKNGLKLAVISSSAEENYKIEEITECSFSQGKIHVMVKAPVQRMSVSWELYKVSAVPFRLDEKKCVFEGVQELIVGKQIKENSVPKVSTISNQDFEDCNSGVGALCLVHPDHYKINDVCLVSLLGHGMPSDNCNLTCEGNEFANEFDEGVGEEK